MLVDERGLMLRYEPGLRPLNQVLQSGFIVVYTYPPTKSSIYYIQGYTHHPRQSLPPIWANSLILIFPILNSAILIPLSYTMSSNNSQSFMGIALIPKLKGKSNYEEWRNAMQGFCEMNGYWRYMLEEIPKPISPPEKELTPAAKEAFETKLMKWLIITDSIRGAIRTTCTIDPMSHVGDMGLASEMWKRVESLYRDTGFIERDSIFTRLSTETLSDFDDFAQFADNMKRNSIRLREIRTKDVPGWMYTTWFLHGLSSEYDSFRMMLTNNRKADQAEGIKAELEFDPILEQVLSLDTQKKVSESRSMKSASMATEAKKILSSSTLSCPYCKKSGHTGDKCYYKHPERASEGFRDRFKGRIADLKSRNQASRRSPQDQNTEALNDDRPRGYMVRINSLTSSSEAGSHD